MADWTGEIASFDLETTGIDTSEDRIVTAAIAQLAPDGTVARQQQWIVNPGVEIPQRAIDVHGITNEVAREHGAAPKGVLEEIARIFGILRAQGIPVVVYNAPFDLTLLAAELERNGLPAIEEPVAVIDPLVLDKRVDKFRKGKRTLDVTCEVYGVEIGNAHDSLADAIAAGRVAQSLLTKYAAELPTDLAELHASQATWFDEQAADFESYMRRVKNPDFTAARGWPVRA